ncbi:MAG TPA: hypothetical protein VNV87_05440, partial [Acidimicrobiales bacterium]|nr:hypothetical protein [Acidimicrobiales bacterium]
ASGQWLQPNQFIEDPSGFYQFYMSPGGVAAVWVLGSGPCPMWTAPFLDYSAGTYGVGWWTASYDPNGHSDPIPGSYLAMQTDGNLVLYTQSGAVVWASNTLVAGSSLAMQSDGNLVMSSSTSVPWATSTNTNRGPALCSGEVMQNNQHIQMVGYNETEVGYQLEFANDGGSGQELDIGPGKNTKETTGVTHIWKSSSAPADDYLVMQADGNLVIYQNGTTSPSLWASGTNSSANGGDWAYLGSGGVLEIFNSTITSNGSNGLSGNVSFLWSNSCGNFGSGCESVGDSIGKAQKISMSPG